MSAKSEAPRIRLTESDLQLRKAAAIQRGDSEAEEQLVTMLEQIIEAYRDHIRLEFFEKADGTIQWEASKKHIGFDIPARK